MIIIEFFLDWCNYHKGICVFIILALICVIIGAVKIENAMYNASIKYEPMISGTPTVREDLNLSYDKSSSYNESVSIDSILEDSVGEFSKSVNEISEIKNVLSKVEDATGESGSLFIPMGASGLSFEDLQIYQFRKSYKYDFDLFSGNDIEVVIVIGNSALSGKIKTFSTGILENISIYHLT